MSCSKKNGALSLIFIACNIGILLTITPIASLLVFYGVAAFFVVLRKRLSGLPRKVFNAFGILALTLALLYYHQSLLIFTGYSAKIMQIFFPGLWEDLTSQALARVGVSYCYLRTVYVLAGEEISLLDFSRYYFFSPTFVSGPIVPPGDFLSQPVRFTRTDIFTGITRIVYGFLKLVLSSILQIVVPLSTAQNQQWALVHSSPSLLWVGVFATGFWLYLNFSGFSDIAIGASRLVGIRIPENFNNPYVAQSLTDFWRRWHISLANWLRANIYNPVTRQLSRFLLVQSLWIAIIPPIITMVVCGLWHGTILPFIIWGAFHGVGLAVDQLYRRFIESKLSPVLVNTRWYQAGGWLVTQAYVTLGWAFFFPLPAPSLTQSVLIVKRLLGIWM